MYKQQMFCIRLVICLTWVVLVGADTKLLRNVSVNTVNTMLVKSVSLDNEDNLRVEGTFVQKYPMLLEPNQVLKLTVIYIADKNGYRAKYVLQKEEIQLITFLNPTTLKSFTG